MSKKKKKKDAEAPEAAETAKIVSVGGAPARPGRRSGARAPAPRSSAFAIVLVLCLNAGVPALGRRAARALVAGLVGNLVGWALRARRLARTS